MFFSVSPHFGGPRQVQRGQLIHESVFKLVEDDSTPYKPKAIIHSNIGWDDKESLSRIMERDPYESAALVLSDLDKPNSSELGLGTLAAVTATGV
jgi:hypothetical protein